MLRRARPARLSLLGPVLLCACAGGAPEPTPAPSTPGPDADPLAALRAELVAMGEQDQAVRQGLGPETMQDTAFLRRMMRTDTVLSERLRRIVAEHGWPSTQRMGPEAARAAFLIVQHTPFDDGREAMRPPVERDGRAGGLDPQAYAAMVDRVRTHRGGAQLYGITAPLLTPTNSPSARISRLAWPAACRLPTMIRPSSTD